MKKGVYHSGTGINISTLIVFLFTLTLPAVFFLFIIPRGVEAQQFGTVITYYGSINSDEEDGRLYFPNTVFVDRFTDEIYLIDGKSRIIIYTSDLFPLYTLEKKDGIEYPQGLTVDAKGNLYVVQLGKEPVSKNRISVYNACLKWERDIYLKGFEGAETFVPYRIAIDEKGNFYVASSDYTGVLYVDGSGRLIDIISPEEEGEKVKIFNVSLDGSGKIYLVSEQKGRIYIYDNDRKFILKFGEKGGSSGKLSRPKAVGIDNRNGRLYVVDYMRHTITVYDKEGQFIFEFGGMGWGEGWFQYPNDLTVDSEGRLLIADLFNHRVQVFNSW